MGKRVRLRDTPMELPSTLVFVYGTLRKGFKYHNVLRDACFVGNAKTRDPYALYIAKYPCLFKGEAVSRITGEVYEVDPPTLNTLDKLEDHPQEYQREQVPVVLDDGGELLAWVYFYPHPIGTLKPCGDYKNSQNI